MEGKEDEHSSNPSFLDTRRPRSENFTSKSMPNSPFVSVDDDSLGTGIVKPSTPFPFESTSSVRRKSTSIPGQSLPLSNNHPLTGRFKRRISHDRYAEDEEEEDEESYRMLAHKKFITEVISNQLDSLQLSPSSEKSEARKALPIYINPSLDCTKSDTNGTSPEALLKQIHASPYSSPLRQVVSGEKSIFGDPFHFQNSTDLIVTHSSSSSEDEQEDIIPPSSYDSLFLSKDEDHLNNSYNHHKNALKKSAADNILRSRISSKLTNAGSSNALIVASNRGGIGSMAYHKTLPSVKKVSPARMKIMKQLLKRYSMMEEASPSNESSSIDDQAADDEDSKMTFQESDDFIEHLDEDELDYDDGSKEDSLFPISPKQLLQPIPLLETIASSSSDKQLVLYRPMPIPRIQELRNQTDDDVTVKMSRGKARMKNSINSNTFGVNSSNYLNASNLEDEKDNDDSMITD